MTDNFVEINAHIKAWLQCAIDNDWLKKSMAKDAFVLLNKKTKTANDLFATDSPRPLVVAFMGGTGVGKSALLNKLANQPIAKSGVERPTSREVTLYHHQSVSLQLLRDRLPVKQIKESTHSVCANKDIIWLDMPDIDSTEQHNKNIVLQCLPFIDVLIYVVSPERYKDNEAWQLLSAKGANYDWFFVFNQWDKGDITQYKDFKQQIVKAEFIQQPKIYKTICTRQAEDEFTQLRDAIQSLDPKKTIKRLESRRLREHQNKIKTQLLKYKQALVGKPQAFDSLTQYHLSSWIKTQQTLKEGIELRIQQVAEHYAQAKTSIKQTNIKIWDDWAKRRLNDYLDELIATANQYGLPTTPIAKAVLNCRNEAAIMVHRQTELACRQALKNPGNALHKVFLKTAHIAGVIVPLFAMGVVAIDVYVNYYNSIFNNTEFLGVNFVLHSVLMILISWLIPYFINKTMRPSREKAALKGLRIGLNTAMDKVNTEISQAIENYQQQCKVKLESLEQLMVNYNKNPLH